MALASVTGGVMFALVFANLVRYVSVENALEQATQKIARCIDPTDPACATVNESASNQSFDWYQVQKANTSTTWADKYDYAARVYQTDWELKFPAYEIHKAPLPPVEWSDWQLPVQDLRAELNPYERRSIHVHAEYPGIPRAEFRPKNNPNFPEFDPLYEESRKNENPNDWNPRQLNKPSDVRRHGGRNVSPDGTVSHNITLSDVSAFSKSDISLKHNRNGGVHQFVTPWYTVPELENTNGVAPTCQSGQVCSVQDMAGGNGDKAWNEYAYIAIKAFAQLKRVKDDPEVKWAGLGTPTPGTPDGWGLQVEIIDAGKWQDLQTKSSNAHQDPAFAEKDNVIGEECLGGRTWGSVLSSSNNTNHHLVLRGAIKRKTSDNSLDNDDDVDAACPHKDRTHWNLAVPRGGAYRIRGALKVRGGDAKANVSILSYVDNYELVRRTAATSACDKDVPLSNTGAVQENCDILCSEFRDVDHVANGQNCQIEHRSTPVCATEATPVSDPSVFSVGRVNCPGETILASCDPTASAYNTATCESTRTQFPNRKICDVSSPTGEKVTIPAQGFACPNATVTPHSVDCNDGRSEVTYRPDGNYGDISKCPAVQATGSRQPDRNQILVGGSVKDVAPTVFSWAVAKDYNPPKWERAIEAVDEMGQPVVDPKSVRELSSIFHPVSPVYSHNDPQWKPSLETFGIPASELKYISEHNNYSIEKGAETPRNIANVYPFANKPEFQIPDFLPSPGSGASCSGQAASMDERLRAYAAAAIPEAGDPAIRFDAPDPIYRETVSIASTSGCTQTSTKNEAAPACTKAKVRMKEISCGAPVYLGSFFAPEKPQFCREHASSCSSSATPLSSPDPEQAKTADIDLALAASVGFNEIERALPGSKKDCQEAGCTEFVIDTIDSKQSRIVARYHMPLSFPLNTILGRDSLSVEKTKQEFQELAIAGRANAGAPN